MIQSVMRVSRRQPSLLLDVVVKSWLVLVAETKSSEIEKTKKIDQKIKVVKIDFFL